MDYETALKTCSEEVQATIKWLEEQVRFDKSKWESRLEKIKELEEKSAETEHFSELRRVGSRGWDKNEILRRLTVKYLCSEALEFYVLSKVKSPLLKEFLDASKKEEFWLEEGDLDGWVDESPHLLWYLSEMGLNSNDYFEEALKSCVKERQMVSGLLCFDYSEHTGPMRVLASVEPDSEATNLTVRYFLDNLDEFKNPYCFDVLAIGVLTLCELNYLGHKKIIEELGNYLKSEQEKEGYWGKIRQSKDGTSHLPIEETSLIIEALSRVFGQNDECVIKAVEWLKRNQKDDGSWWGWGYVGNTAYACLALISAGEGPKASLEEIGWNETLTRQKLELTRPKFVQTSPNLGVTEIKEKIHEMLNNANERIWICSRFITEFWTDIMNLKRENPNLNVKIITHPIKGKMKQKYEGEGKKFVEPAFDALQRLLGKDFKPEPLLHARLYIVDNEVLISSADITSEQLEKEFNAGIWTRDKETVEEAIKFFENIWNASNDKIQLTEEEGNKHE